MFVTLLFFLSILLNNFRNLVIFCMNVDIDKLLLWKFCAQSDHGYRYSIKVVILSSTVTTVLCKVWHVRARDQPAHAHSLIGLITGHFNALVIISVLRCTASHVDLVCEDMMACKATQSGQSLHCPAKVSCILRHLGVQLILAYSLAMPCYPCSR